MPLQARRKDGGLRQVAPSSGEMYMHEPRQQISKDQEVYEEICLVDLQVRYGSTPEGRKYIEDIVSSQKG